MFGRGNDDDHLYDFNTSVDVGKGPMTSAFRTNNGPLTTARPIMTAMGNKGAMPASRMGLTTAQGGGSSDARPMTSVSGAGYSASRDRSFDPLNIGKGPAPPLSEKSDNSSEDKAKEMEKGVHRLIEASADAIVTMDLQKALEKAKEAGKAERALCKFRESHSLTEHINYDLTYAVCFNLANAYFHNKMYDEALNTYNLIVKNKQYPQSGRLRVNMGNIYYEQKKYPQAIKMYRMALDQIPATGKELRFRILRNIGNSFVKLGQFQDAIDNFEQIMTGSPEIKAALNLMLCLYARGDKDKMKRHFMKMLTIPILGMTEEDQEKAADLLAEAVHLDRQDSLKEELNRRLDDMNDKILVAARLLAPMIDDSKDEWESGYKWTMEQLRQDHETVASKLEIDLSMAYMKKRKFEEAIEVLKAFERKESSLRVMAATNLSFIHFLEGDYSQAEKHADAALKLDRYNAKALVNKGNCYFMAGEYTRAKEKFLEAVGVEADCVEAIYNLGLVNNKLNCIQEAHDAFDKLHTILPSVPESLFQLGMIYEKGNTQQDLEQAVKTYEMLLSKIPADPNLCGRLGGVYEKLDDENAACHWYAEAHRHYPVNLNVISWLGVWYVKREMYEQAIEYFERASAVQPNEVKWRLMVTSCYRRLGDLNRALELYQQIHEDHPENIESLQYLEALCKDLERPYEEYSRKLEKLRRSQPVQQPTNAGATRVGNAPVAQQAPQRTERPKPERSDRPSAQSQSKPADEPSTAAVSKSPLAAPRSGVQANARAPSSKSAKGTDDDDDFFDTDVTSLLG